MTTDLPFPSLEKIFKDLFTPEELRSFIRNLPEGKGLAAALPGGEVSLDRLSYETAALLQRRGMIDQDLFDALLNDKRFSRRINEIQHVAALWGIPTLQEKNLIDGLDIVATSTQTWHYSPTQLYEEAKLLWETGGGGPLSRELFDEFAKLGGFPQSASNAPETVFPKQESLSFLEILREWLQSSSTEALPDEIEGILEQIDQTSNWVEQKALLQKLVREYNADHCKISSKIAFFLLRGSEPTKIAAIDAAAKIKTSFTPAILALIELCFQKNRLTGEKASGALAAISEAGLPHLIKALDREPGQVNLVTSTFRKIGQASIPFLLHAFDSKQSQRSGTVVYILGEIRPPTEEAIAKLTEILIDSDEFRSNAARSLRFLGSSAIPTLCSLLEHGNEKVRHASINTLKEIVQEEKENAKEALYPLVDALFSNDSKVVRESSDILQYLGKEIIPALKRIEQAFFFHTTQTFPYGSLSYALQDLGEEASPVVARLLKHNDTKIRGEIANVVPSTPSEAWQRDVLPVLVRLLECEQGEWALQNTIGAIQKFGEKAKDAVDGLIKHLAGDHQLSRRAANALGDIAKGSEKASNAICEIYWTYPHEKTTYIRALQSIGIVEALGRLFKEEMEQGPHIPSELWQSLASFREQAITVLPMLLELLKKDEEASITYHQSKIAALLGIIGPRAKEVIPLLIQSYKMPEQEGMTNRDSRDDILEALLLISADDPLKTILQLIETLLPEIPEIKEQVIKQLNRQQDRITIIEVGRNSEERERIRNQAAKIANCLENPETLAPPSQIQGDLISVKLVPNNALSFSSKPHQITSTFVTTNSKKPVEEPQEHKNIRKQLLQIGLTSEEATVELIAGIVNRIPHPGTKPTEWSAQNLGYQLRGSILFTGGTNKLRYLVLESLGEGGWGETYRAIVTAHPHREVCIKRPNTKSLNNYDLQELIEEFQGEARIMMGLQHPSLACLEDLGQINNGPPFLIMEYVHALPFAPRTFGSWSIEQRISLFKQIVDGVAYLHGLHRVHGDLKPQNILIDSATKHAKIIDFGMATTSESIKRTLSLHSIVVGPELEVNLEDLQIEGVRGTPGYIAPELLEGSASSRNSDMFSLGCLLYYILVGCKPPWTEELLTERTVFRGATRSAKDRVPDIDYSWNNSAIREQVEVLFAGMVAFDPRERPSIREVQEQLENLGKIFDL